MDLIQYEQSHLPEHFMSVYASLLFFFSQSFPISGSITSASSATTQKHFKVERMSDDTGATLFITFVQTDNT